MTEGLIFTEEGSVFSVEKLAFADKLYYSNCKLIRERGVLYVL